MSWTLSGGKTKSVHIGGRDFSETMRFIQAENGEVSKIESGFDVYLDTSTRFWCDPYIIPRLWSGGSAAAENIQRISFIADGKRIVLKAGAKDFMPRLERLSALRTENWSVHCRLLPKIPFSASTRSFQTERSFPFPSTAQMTAHIFCSTTYAKARCITAP